MSTTTAIDPDRAARPPVSAATPAQRADQCDGRTAEAHAAEHRLLSVLDAVSSNCAVLDNNGVIVATNQAWRAFAVACGQSADFGLGDSYLDITRRSADSGDSSAIEALARIEDVLTGRIEHATLDYAWTGVDDVVSWFMMNIDAIDPAVGGAVIRHQDITERKRNEFALLYQAHHDALTGLFNREHIVHDVESACRRPDPGGRPTGVLLLDLDRFKHINDSLGHPAGDSVLREAGLRIRGAIRDTDSLGRLGGDEFLIVCRQLSDVSNAAEIAQRVLTALESPMAVEGRMLRVRASIGVALTSPDSREGADTLVRQADTAMYESKARGGGRFTFFDDELGRRAIDRLELEHDLHDAIERRELQLHFQPQVDLIDGHVVAFEALSRWTHPMRGQVSPAEFIKIAEDSDLINRLGSWALDSACAQLADWQRAGAPAELRIAVNVSARQLGRASFVEEVATVVSAHSLRPCQVELEITETAYVGGLDRYGRILRDLASLGVGIVLDDFGMGNASLHHLSQLPITAVKIDREFVAELSGGPTRSRSIVNGILAISREFGMGVVAEGIETEAQAHVLRGMGCRVGQGYLLGRPAPASSLKIARVRAASRALVAD